MIVQTPSKILKSDFRNWDQIGNASVAEIFSKKENQPTNLTLVLEIVLEKDQVFSFPTMPTETIMILPLFGEISFENNTIVAGENLVYQVTEQKDLVFKNNQAEEKLDFLLFCFETNHTNHEVFKNTVLFEQKNELYELNPYLKNKNQIGLFSGRESGNYLLQSSNSVFGMVINGAFEFQNRLLENRDAIVLWDVEEIEFEALSENALLLFIEM